MAPQNKVDIVTLELTFMPHMHPKHPRITLAHKTHSPSGSRSKIQDWFNYVMAEEISAIPPNLGVGFTEWSITSGDASLFTVHGYRFDKIILVFGEKLVHYNYYQTSLQRCIEGDNLLPDNYCGCCLNNQYVQIMDWINCCIMKKSGLYQY